MPHRSPPSTTHNVSSGATPKVTRPQSAAAAGEIIADALGGGGKVWLGGSGSRLHHPVGNVDAVVSSSSLNQISLYSPEEITLRAGAGTLIAQLKHEVEANNQLLPFEPRDLSAVIGGERGQSTLGGELAIGIAGPRRIQRAGMRDCVLGVEFVNGQGQVIRSGGRVAKNVTGLNLARLQCAAMGTLGLVTSVAVRTISAPVRETTLMFLGVDRDAALPALIAARHSVYTVTAAAYLPAPDHHATRLPWGNGDSILALRVEGLVSGVAFRHSGLQRQLEHLGAAAIVEQDESRALWQAVSDLDSLIAADSIDPYASMLWCIKTSAVRMNGLITAIEQLIPSRYRPAMVLDWGGALLWLRVLPREHSSSPAAPTASAAVSAVGVADVEEVVAFARQLRSASRHWQADASWLPVRGARNDVVGNELRHRIPLTQPLGGNVGAIQQGLRARFDPAGIFNSDIAIG